MEPKCLDAEQVLGLQKSQAVRVFDFVVLGPFLGYAAYEQLKADRPFLFFGLAAAAVGTVWYNFLNYQKIQAYMKQQGHISGIDPNMCVEWSAGVG